MTFNLATWIRQRRDQPPLPEVQRFEMDAEGQSDTVPTFHTAFLVLTMKSTSGRPVKIPCIQKRAFQTHSAVVTSHSVTLQADDDYASNSPAPATPELDWAETPPTTEYPQTPRGWLQF
jgi:hypothetical protein